MTRYSVQTRDLYKVMDFCFLLKICVKALVKI